MKNSTAMDETIVTPVALALAYTGAEEQGAARSVVSWTMAALDMRLGWTVKVKAADMKSAVKALREKHAYHRDQDGTARLDGKGNKVKRSAVYDKLSLVEKAATFIHSHRNDWLDLLHTSAVVGDGDAMADTVEQIALALSEAAQGDSVDAIKYFLTHEKAKEKAAQDAAKTPEQVAQEALDALKAEQDKAAQEKAAQVKAQDAAKREGLTFADVMAALDGMTLDRAQLDMLAEYCAKRGVEIVLGMQDAGGDTVDGGDIVDLKVVNG